MASIRSSSSSMFQPSRAETTTLSDARASGSVRSSCSAESASRSALFITISMGRSPTPRSSSTPWTISARSDQAAVDLDLGLAGAAADADAADLAFEVGPGAGQPRQQVLEPRQLHLDATLVGARPLGKDVQDQQRAVDGAAADDLLHGALRVGRQLVVDDGQVCLPLD